MKHLMIDIETLDTCQTAVILSIGACFFDPMTQQIGDRFYSNVDILSCRAFGLTESRDTYAWWSDQPQAARDALSNPQRITLETALESFYAYAKRAKFFWANSPSFDLAIVRNAYRVTDIKPPWHFRQERDCRTLLSLVLRGEISLERGEDLVQHIAVDDAVHQARVVMDCMQWLKVVRSSKTKLKKFNVFL